MCGGGSGVLRACREGPENAPAGEDGNDLGAVAGRRRQAGSVRPSAAAEAASGRRHARALTYAAGRKRRRSDPPSRLLTVGGQFPLEGATTQPRMGAPLGSSVAGAEAAVLS